MSKQRNKFSDKKRKYLKTYESCFVIFFSSIGIGAIVSVLMSLPIALIIDHNSSLSNFISGMCATIITLFLLSYREGYRSKKINFIELLLIQLIVLVTQIIIVFIFGHAIYFSGPTVFLSRFILNVFHQGTINAKAILENYRWTFMLAAYIFLYTPIIIFGEYLGSKKHKKDFINYREVNL